MEAFGEKYMALPSSILVVNVSVDSDVEDEWNSWYDEKHLPEILNCPHFISGKRYLCQEENGRNYLTVYELASNDALITPEFLRARGWGQFSEKLQFSTRLYNQIGMPGR